ncbi:site-specific integrase [Acuticoccus kandeliae]|uniref:site-specific integrase n=1 Tax=Acuticoccus kandeliae TaxID=2073160 RepID=UPI001300A8BA|nr:tyrosine-type recombinase/integrase [Acuticoccus kandeliae]
MTLRYVHQYRDVRGRMRTYFRYRGKRWPLPDPADDDFGVVYRRLCETVAKRAAGPKFPAETSLNWLTRAYKDSAHFKRLAPRTQQDYSSLLSTVSGFVGDKSYAGFTSARIIRHVQDKLDETPRRADYAIAALSAVFGWAKKRGMVSENPCSGIEKINKGGAGYRAWTAAEIATFVTGCNDFEWLVFVLGLYTGQRPGDLVKLTWFEFDGERFRILQGKTKVALEIDAHPVVRETLAAMRRTDGTILAKADGSPLKRTDLSSRWRHTQARLGLSGCTIHGLRTTSSTVLAEAGASTKQLMAMSGHKTSLMAEHYTRNAEQRRLAKSSVALLPNIVRTKKWLTPSDSG